MARGVYDIEMRAKVISDIRSGDSNTVIAERYDIPLGTVKAWRHDVGVVSPTRIQPDKTEELSQLVADYLASGLRALRAQSELASDRVWLEKQNSADLAIFHGVLADKLVRILSALRSTSEEAAAVPSVVADEGPHH